MLDVGPIGPVVVDVDPAAINDRPHHVVELIHPIAHAKNVRVGCCPSGPGKGSALQSVGNFHAGQREHGRGKIDEVDRVFDSCARCSRRKVLPSRWIEDDQRNVRATFMKKTFAARQYSAVVGIVKNDGVLCESRVGECLEFGGNLSVELRHATVEPRPVGADLRSVWLVWGDPHGSRIEQRPFVVRKQTALVADLVVEHAEEWLAGRTVLVVVAIPRVLNADRCVVVCLGLIGRVIASRTQSLRKTFEPRRNGSLSPHVVGRSAGDRIQAADECESRRRADRHRKAALVQHTIAGQLVDRRRPCQRITVTPQQAAVVFAYEPENVRPSRPSSVCGVQHG